MFTICRNISQPNVRQMLQLRNILREKCPHSELFWFPFSLILTEYGEILRISPYSVRMRENADQKNSIYGHYLRSDNNDNLQQFSQLNLPNLRCGFCGKKSISYLGPEIWNIVPNEFKKETSLDTSNKTIKK